MGRVAAGGITPDNANLVIEAGANALVAGSAVFGASASPSVMPTLAPSAYNAVTYGIWHTASVATQCV